MEDIIKSLMLEYEKSSFMIDLINHKSGNKFVKITQSIVGSRITNELNINPTILTDLISILQQFKEEIDNTNIQHSSLYFSDEKQKSIINRYFKGVSIQDLTIQFDCSKQIIEQILFNKGIEIVDNNLPQGKNKFRFYKRKR